MVLRGHLLHLKSSTFGIPFNQREGLECLSEKKLLEAYCESCRTHFVHILVIFNIKNEVSIFSDNRTDQTMGLKNSNDFSISVYCKIYRKYPVMVT